MKYIAIVASLVITLSISNQTFARGSTYDYDELGPKFKACSIMKTNKNYIESVKKTICFKKLAQTIIRERDSFHDDINKLHKERNRKNKQLRGISKRLTELL